MCNSSLVSTSHDVEESWDDEFQQLVQTFPKDKSFTRMNLYFFQGFWCPSIVLKAVISCQKHFQAFDSDIIIATLPKCGTTSLKALTFSTLYRNQFTREKNPLLTYNPHSLVRFIDYDFYFNDTCPDLGNCTLYQPRLFSIHLPYAYLPTSIKDSNKTKTIEILREAFFRKAKTGDWSNYLTPSMVERLEKLIQEKLENSGLTFKLFSKTSKDITST
ncbi:hypothetical protein GOBAR_DD12239 [Gossypium barbadense]|nr:hypothetical protein GOBAR_DD12239 [Gossypium barbadense]